MSLNETPAYKTGPPQESIFSKMTRLANAHGAVNLAQGFPDFDVDPVLIEAVFKAMHNGHNQYAPMAGNPNLREVLSALHKRGFQSEYNADTEITITAGATQGIYTTIATLIRPGDEVLLFAPAYDCYAPMVRLHGGIPIYTSLEFPDFAVNWDEVERLVNAKTRLIILNNPHNPCGMVWQESDFEKLQQLTEKYPFYILSDEVYAYINFHPDGHRSIGAYPALRERAYIVYSFGKTLHATGWKIGYVVAPNALMKPFRELYQYQVFAVNAPVQQALSEYLPQADLSDIALMYHQKQQFFEKSMQKTAFKPIPSYGSYFQLYDYSAISDKEDVDFADWLTKEIGVAAIPISVFYPDKKQQRMLRFCFAKQEGTVDEALRRLVLIGDR